MRQITDVINLGRELQKVKQTQKISAKGNISNRNKGGKKRTFVENQANPNVSYVHPKNLVTKFKLANITNQRKDKPTEYEEMFALMTHAVLGRTRWGGETEFRQKYARYGFDNHNVPTYLFPRFVEEIKKNPNYFINDERLEMQLFMKDLSIMHTLLQYSTNVGSGVD